MRRRNYLALTAGALTVGTAGCSSSSDSGSDGSNKETDSGGTATATATATPTETTVDPASVGDSYQRLIVQFYRYLDDGNTDAAAQLVHPDSPLRDGSGELFSDSESIQAMADNEVTVRSVAKLPWRKSETDSQAVVSATVNCSADAGASEIRWEIHEADGKWHI
jgi:hypothetical protein